MSTCVPEDAEGTAPSIMAKLRMFECTSPEGVQLDDPRVRELERPGTPFVLIGRTLDPRTLDHVDIDLEQTLVLAGRHLMDRGHSRITLLDDAVGSRDLAIFGPVRRSRDSHEDEARQRGLVPSALSCEATPYAGTAAAGELLRSSPGTELGRMGVEALIDQLEGRVTEIRQELVLCSLEEGLSTASPPATASGLFRAR